MKDRKWTEPAVGQPGAARRPSRAKVLGLAAGIIAAGLTAGLLLGQVVPMEGVTGYCLYFTAAPVPLACTALHTCTYGHGLTFYSVPRYNSTPCNNHNAVVCGLTLQYDESSSTACPPP